MPPRTPTDQHQTIRTRALSRRPVSVDVDARSFSAVLTSEAPVRTWIPDPLGKLDGNGCPVWIEVDEVLVSTGVDLSRSTGMPLVDSHNTFSIDSVLGVVDAIRIEGVETLGSAIVIDARIVPSKADLLPAINDGFFQQLSAGYVVHEYELEEREGQVPLARATRWTLLEASLVPIGADANAMVRSAPAHFPPPVFRKRGADSQPPVTKRNAMKKMSKRSAAGKREADAVAPEDFEALVTAAEEAVAAADEAVAAVEEVVDSLPDDTSEEIVERARKLRGARAEDDEPKNDDEPAADAEEDKEVEKVRSLAKTYGRDVVKLVDDLKALGTRSAQIKAAVRSVIVKRSATSDAPAVPKAPAQRSDPLDTNAVYARWNKRG